MKGPQDHQLENTSAQATEGFTAIQKPEGGKVLQRLLLFAQERGLSLQPLQQEEQTEATENGNEAIIAAKDTDTNKQETIINYAQSLIEAAEALNAAHQLVTPSQNEALLGQPASPPIGTGPQWRFLGPVGMANGQTYGDTRVVVSGRVGAIAVDPSNSNHILCGSAGGGVWESTNRGAGWIPRTDYMPSLTIGALAFNPSAPATVYCGTGEGNFYWWLGAGLLRSTNGGATWSVLSTTFVGQGFFDLIVDRANGNHLLAATTSGIYESADGGATWNLRRGGICWDVSLSAAGGATAEVLAACSDGVYRSTNGGTTYAKITLPGAPASFNRLAVDISRSNPAIAYAFGASGNTAYLYQRNASGTWAQLTPPAGLSTGQAWYDWYLAVAPDNAMQIYLGAIEAYRGTFSGSWSWVTISNKAGDDIHPDQHTIAFDPANANVIYAGCDGGLFTSPNRGDNWTSLNPGLGITEIEYMAQDYGSSRWLIAGTQDNGSIRYSGPWEHVADGDGGDCGVNRADANTVYHSYYNMGMERSTTKGNFGSFSWIGPNVPSGYSNLFYPPMEVNNDTVAQAGQSVYISRNKGTSWTEVTFPSGGIGSAMYIPNPDTVFIGTNNGNIYRVKWSGTAWSSATALTSPRAGANISDLYVDPGNLNRIWATFTSLGGNRVFRSDNGGTSWINCTTGLPNLPINAIEVQPGNANRVWVAADVGVYQSLNAGSTWSAFANGLPNALADDLLYHPNARVLRVGMRNRGVWEIPVDGWLTKAICGVQFTGSLTPNQTQRWFTFNWPATWHVIWTVMPVTPIPGNPEITWKVQVERASSEFVTYWIVVTNLTNQTISFEGRYAILSFY